MVFMLFFVGSSLFVYRDKLCHRSENKNDEQQIKSLCVYMC